MSFSLLQPLRELPLAFFDVETTGASAQWGDRIIELGIVRIEAGAIACEYQQLLNPARRIGAGITALTGISGEMVADQPPFSHVADRVIELLGNAVIVGHNVRFDLSFLNEEFRRCGREISELLGKTTVLDTVRIARKLYGRGGNGLQRLSRRLELPPATAHRALADAQTTHRVLERMLEPLTGWSLPLVDVIALQGGPMTLRPATPRENPLPLELQEALEQRQPVMMEYLDARQTRTHRIIEPLEIRRFRGELMLVAHCHMRNDRRTFKLDRIVQLTKVPEGLNDPGGCAPV
jgi:DNA polymerase III epsilon subunit family exonuclease